jgi:hypothetical protein
VVPAVQAAQWADPAFVLGGWVPPTVNAALTAGPAGTTVDVNWSAPAGHSPDDVIALCPVLSRTVHAPRCVAAGRVGTGRVGTGRVGTTRVGTTASIGTVSFPLPQLSHGAYQVRYYVNGRVTAVSAPLG